MQDSTIIGVAGLAAGLLTSAMAYYWSYKTRGYPHREYLYQIQIDEYRELSVGLSRSVNPCYDFLFGKTTLTPEMRTTFLGILNKAADDSHEQFRRGAAILRLDVAMAVNQVCIKLLMDIPKMDNATQIGTTLLQAEMEVYSAIRKNAGIEPLTKEMWRAFGRR